MLLWVDSRTNVNLFRSLPIVLNVVIAKNLILICTFKSIYAVLVCKILFPYTSKGNWGCFFGLEWK